MSRNVFGKHEPKIGSLQENLILLYGEPGGGKSTLVAGFPDSLVIDTEGGQQQFGHELYAHTPTWPEFKEAVEQAMLGTKIKTRIVDSISRAYEMCRQYVLATNGWTDERDGPAYGGGFAAVRNEFRSTIDPLLHVKQSGIGTVLVTHTQSELVEKPSGDVTIVKPEFADNRTAAALNKLADCTLFYGAVSNGGLVSHAVHAAHDGLFTAKDRTGKFPAKFVLPEVGREKSHNERASIVFSALQKAYDSKS